MLKMDIDKAKPFEDAGMAHIPSIDAMVNKQKRLSEAIFEMFRLE